MLNMNLKPKNYLNHVPLIDSECDPRGSQYLTNQVINKNNLNNQNINTHSVTNQFYKSPLRERQNKINLSNMIGNLNNNVNNTPMRNGNGYTNNNNMSNKGVNINIPYSNPINLTPKPSLSPLRSRKNNQTIYDNNYNTSNSGALNTSSYSVSSSRLNNNNQPSQSQSRIKKLTIQTELQSQCNYQQQQEEYSCFNHPQKSAQFFVQAPQENMFCCSRCAILLASQGFKVCKISQTIKQYNLSNNPNNLINTTNNNNNKQKSSSSQSSYLNNQTNRKKQIQSFLNNLQSITYQLQSSLTQLSHEYQSGQQELEQQISQIDDYYQQFYQILDQHKNRVTQQLREQFQKQNRPHQQLSLLLKQSVLQSQSMKKDIQYSWDDIIFNAEQREYRPVINNYQEKINSFISFIKQNQLENIHKIVVRKLRFKNTEYACQALEKGLQVEWCAGQHDEEEEGDQSVDRNLDEMKCHQQNCQDKVKYKQKAKNNEMKQKHYRKQKIQKKPSNPIQDSKQSDLPQNPVQYLQKDEKFMKSSLKNLVGLFSSFDD